MGDREDGLGEAMRVGGVDVAPDHVVTHEAINDIRALAFSREIQAPLLRELLASSRLPEQIKQQLLRENA